VKPCQLCGTSSWGLVPRFVNVDAQSPQTHLIGRDLNDYRKCDNCDSYAAVLMINGPAAVFGNQVPKPDTWTERIVRTILSKEGVTQPASKVVLYAREIEAELDDPSIDVVKTDWMVLRFKDRAAMETWLEQGLRHTDVPESAETRVSRQFADWVIQRS